MKKFGLAAAAAAAITGCASLDSSVTGAHFLQGQELTQAAQKNICADMAGGLAKIYSPAFTRLALTFAPAQNDAFSATCISLLRTAGFEVKELSEPVPSGTEQSASQSVEDSGHSSSRKNVTLSFVLDSADGLVRATMRPDGRSVSRAYSSSGVPASAWAVQGK